MSEQGLTSGKEFNDSDNILYAIECVFVYMDQIGTVKDVNRVEGHILECVSTKFGQIGVL